MTASAQPYLSNAGGTTITASTTLTAEGHSGLSSIALSAAAGLTITLPAATGTGNVYDLFIATTVTSNDYIIQVANATDTMQGGVAVATDIAGVTCPTVAASDTITMNGTTTGGLIGSSVRLVDRASGVWGVTGFLKSSGVEATPFSAAVS